IRELSEKQSSIHLSSVAMWLQRNFEEALHMLERAIQMSPEEWDAYFWKGMACASLGQEEEAIEAVERSLELELPPILLTPLRWFEHDRPKILSEIRCAFDGSL